MIVIEAGDYNPSNAHSEWMEMFVNAVKNLIYYDFSSQGNAMLGDFTLFPILDDFYRDK